MQFFWANNKFHVATNVIIEWAILFPTLWLMFNLVFRRMYVNPFIANIVHFMYERIHRDVLTGVNGLFIYYHL